jgi:hypothetical protein
MDNKCRKFSRVNAVCLVGQPLSPLLDMTGPAPACPRPSADQAPPRSIAFDVDPHPQIHPKGGVLIPGYNVPALPIKPMRDPSLTLIALSGIDPEGPVMVEVPLVQSNSTFTAMQALAGTRVGYADRYGRGDGHEPIEHRAPFMRALDVLRRAGAQLLPVPAQRVDDTLTFNLRTHNEIDELVNEHRLDALVSDSQSAAFHGACWSGYPRFAEALDGGATLWFYGARWSKESLAALAQGYRNACCLENAQHGLPGVLNNPTR